MLLKTDGLSYRVLSVLQRTFFIMLSFFTTALSFAAALTPVLGAPNVALRDVERFAGKIKQNGYIVTMKDKSSRDSLVEALGSSVTALYSRTSTGFAGKASFHSKYPS